jgi:uncharacterized protein (DUF58 family)
MQRFQEQDTNDGLIHISFASLIALRRSAESLSLQHSRIRAAGVGGYQSTFKGRGMEFDEVRPYSPGDDARTLDWRVTARTGKPYTKLFREERERPVIVWLDMNTSMYFATQGAFKVVRAAQAAALIGWSAASSGDRVGAVLIDEATHAEFEPKRGRATLLRVLRAVAERTQVKHARKPVAMSVDAWNQALMRLRRVAQPGSMVVLISDFALLNEQGRAHIAQLARHSELLWIQVNDPLEIELPAIGDYRITDGRGFANLSITAELQQRYRAAIEQQRQETLKFTRHYGIKHCLLPTHQEPLAVLSRSLGVGHKPAQRASA